MIDNYNDYILDTEGAVDVVGDIDTLEVIHRWGGIGASEYLRRTHPSPKLTYEELEAANWSPSELNF